MTQTLFRIGVATTLMFVAGSHRFGGQALASTIHAAEPPLPLHLAQSPATPATITELYAHNQKGQRAVTLFVQNLPVLTFLGDETETATPIAMKLEQLHQSDVDAETITVRWQPQRKAYVIQVAEQPLLQMNANILLAGTTGDIAEDALQITNRLRRLLGNAAPLSAIAGRPQPVKPKPKPIAARVLSTQRGQASWYGGYFHGRRTASGEIYNQYALTAAHKKLKFGTRVRVTNLRNGQSVIVRINDRGPFIRGRIIDLSRKAAQAIGMISSGVAPVKVEVLGRP